MKFHKPMIRPSNQHTFEHFFLVAQQRSGTGALGSVVEQHEDFAYLGEIFHPDELSMNGFVNSIQKLETDLLAYARRQPSDLDRIWSAFLLQSHQELGKNRLLIDLKWNNLRMLDPAFHSPFQGPYILEIAKQNSTGVIFLTRRNAVRTFVSATVAQRLNSFHTTSEIVNDLQVDIAPDDLLLHLAHSQNVDEYLRSLMSQHEFVLELDYSQLFSTSGNLSVKTAEKLEEFFGVGIGDLAHFKPGPTRQTPGRLSQVISNYQQVVEALTGSPYFWMLVENSDDW